MKQQEMKDVIKAAYIVPHPPLIIPQIGKGQERAIQATIDGYKRIAKEVQQINPDTIVIVSPHSIMYADYFHISPGDHATGDFSAFRAPEISFQIAYDKEFADKLTTMSEQENLPAGYLGEQDPSLDHGTMVPIYFLKEALGTLEKTKFVRIGLSGLSFEEHYRLGRMIQKTAVKLGRTIVFIASGDLSHRLKEDGPYGYKKEGPEYDKRIMEYAQNADFLSMLLMKEEACELAGECGQRSFCMMAGVLDQRKVEATKLSYEGPFGVGYGIVSFHPTGYEEGRSFLKEAAIKKEEDRRKRREQEDCYVGLARTALEEYVRTGTVLAIPTDLPKELIDRQAGCFVSLKKEGKLRGCIGTIAPTKHTLAQEIIENAINAAENDPRFDPVEEEELLLLEYSVDVLNPPEPIESMEELDVKRYGVIVSKGYKRGLLLPNLDGIDTVNEQVRIAMQKAGILETEEVRLERFEVVRHY